MKHTILRVLTAVETRYDGAKFRRQQRRGLGKLQIMPFVGFGTLDELFLRGRVLRDKGIHAPMDNATMFTNLVDTYKRFQSDEIPGATLRARIGDYAEETTTNVEGFFEFHLTPGPLAQTDDHTILIALELVDYPGKALNPVEPAEFKAQGQV